MRALLALPVAFTPVRADVQHVARYSLEMVLQQCRPICPVADFTRGFRAEGAFV